MAARVLAGLLRDRIIVLSGRHQLPTVIEAKCEVAVDFVANAWTGRAEFGVRILTGMDVFGHAFAVVPECKQLQPIIEFRFSQKTGDTERGGAQFVGNKPASILVGLPFLVTS